ncbi:cytochrome b/b6 domain-containing protein [Noviherbaspirillum pedocola]|uniref:Cytochrome b/b6 domain-containing protein n=1 Tax=Noviherbaspirillum pedocola TaxID=2801341 RepID=A0A934SYJ8_9BURK|nr:cytochrome b/b6 domain-containing protein [Noviherbaspirillum pedocola]MBK4737675.1 cytochrome b/b6 domain-containing protein [Noviherbaspirillum pedocola]
MNTLSEPGIEAAVPGTVQRGVLIWDAPVRLFHWLLVLCFAGAYLTAESDSLRLVHVTLGYTMAGLVAFRILWGCMGTHHARFTAFVRGPRAVLAYTHSLRHGKPQHHAGHNPAGAVAILGLLSLAALLAASGWATYQGREWLEDVHEGLANVMLALVAIHVAAVVLSSWLHHENLVAAMIHGRKPAPAAEGIRSSWRSVAALLLAAVLAFWWWQWRTAPEARVERHAVAAQRIEQGATGRVAMRECGHAHTPC